MRHQEQPNLVTNSQKNQSDGYSLVSPGEKRKLFSAKKASLLIRGVWEMEAVTAMTHKNKLE